MNTIQRITKNISVLFISQMVSNVMGFFILMYTARYLGVEGFGILSLALAFTGIFSIFMDLGLSPLTTREVARDKTLEKDYVANVSSIKLILIIVTFGLILVIGNLLGYNQQTMLVIYLIALYTIFTTFSQFFYSIFQAHEKMEYQSLGVILSSISILAGVFVVIYLKFNIIQFSLIYVFSGAFILIYALIIYTNKFSLPKISFRRDEWKLLIKESWPFAITSISANIYTWIDTVIISVIQGAAAVGLYNASYKLALFLMFIPLIFSYAIFPIMSQYHVSSKDSLNFTFEKFLKVMLILALPIGVGTVIIAKNVILLIYGSQYIDSIIVLQILIWSTVLIFARTPFEKLLESSNRQLVVTKVFFVGAIFNVILNIIVIPHYSYIGAAIVTVLTDIIILGLLNVATRNMGFTLSKNTKYLLFKVLIGKFNYGISSNIFTKLKFIYKNYNWGFDLYYNIIILKIFDSDELLMFKSIFSK